MTKQWLPNTTLTNNKFTITYSHPTVSWSHFISLYLKPINQNKKKKKSYKQSVKVWNRSCVLTIKKAKSHKQINNYTLHNSQYSSLNPKPQTPTKSTVHTWHDTTQWCGFWKPGAFEKRWYRLGDPIPTFKPWRFEASGQKTPG